MFILHHTHKSETIFRAKQVSVWRKISKSNFRSQKNFCPIVKFNAWNSLLKSPIPKLTFCSETVNTQTVQKWTMIICNNSSLPLDLDSIFGWCTVYCYWCHRRRSSFIVIKLPDGSVIKIDLGRVSSWACKMNWYEQVNNQKPNMNHTC